MSTLAVVEEILRETGVPMSVRQIVEYSQGRLPTKSRTPDTVVARDLSMDIKRHGTGSKFERVSPGRYAIRGATATVTQSAAPMVGEGTTSVLAAAIRSERAPTLPASSIDTGKNLVKPAKAAVTPL
jgi:hypothetical protein